MAYFNRFQSTVFLSFFILQGENLLAGNTHVVSGSGGSSSSGLPRAPAVTPPGLVAQRQPAQEEELYWRITETITRLESDVPPSAAQFASLFSRLPSNTAHLSLARRGLTAAGLTHLMAWFRAGNGARLTELNLSRNPIGPEGARSIENTIRERFWTQLEELALYGNQLGENAATMALFQAMGPATLPRLRVLHLMDNGLAEASFNELANVLNGNRLPALQRLILSENALGDGEAAQGVLEGAANVPTLTQLALINTGLGNQAVAGLTRMLAAGQFRNLQELHIHGNLFDATHAKALAKAWKDAGHDPEKLHLKEEGE